MSDAPDQAGPSRHDQAISHMMTEGAKSAALATLGVFGFHYAADRFVPAYRNFARSPKLFWLSSAVVAAYWIRAEKAHLEFMEEHRNETLRKREEADNALRSRK